MVIRMRLLTVRFFLAGMLLSCVLFLAAHAQQSAMTPEAVQAADPIVGSWKLNIEKSTNPTAESELITITPEGKQFQITFQAMQSNKYNPHYLVVTDMKGTTSKPVQADGKLMNPEYRITRNQPNAFVMESVSPPIGWKSEFAVSADGKTLTVHELPGSASRIIGGKVDSNGVIRRFEQVLVFDKISDSEGRSLSQRMTETDAAQKAAAAEKAAAQAALDATACSLTPGQIAAPRVNRQPKRRARVRLPEGWVCHYLVERTQETEFRTLQFLRALHDRRRRYRRTVVGFG